MSQPTPGTAYHFGPFRYDSAQRLLFRDAELVALPPKAIDTLQVLLERRGQVVEKADLLKLVWPDCVVEEVGLARNISLLRKALGDDVEAYIATIPKRGYRFVAESDNSVARGGAVAASAPIMHPRRWVGPVLAAGLIALIAVVYWQFYWPSRYVPRAAGTASLAVIPLDCLSPDLERDAFSQAFAETLVEEVSKLKAVQVISPSTIQRYRRLRIPTAVMARLLGLQVVVEGTAQKSGQQVRIAVRLSDVHSGALIWADRYDIGAGDLGAQAEAARAVAAQIGQRLAP